MTTNQEPQNANIGFRNVSISGTTTCDTYSPYTSGGAFTFNSAITTSATKTVQTPSSGTLVSGGTVAVLTAPGTANSGTSSETNLFAGATSVPALTTLSTLAGFPLAANSLRAGRVAKLKLYGSYSTNGATATITPNLYFNTASASTKIGTGIASGTFASAAGPLSFGYDIMLYMLDATHCVVGGSIVLNGATPATTVSESPSLLSAAAGVVIDPTVAGNISASWTGSSANAGNNFQLLAGSLEFLN